MSPEQAEGQLDDVSRLSDIYSIGAILYPLLTGRKPYSSPAGTPEANKILELVRRGPPTSIVRIAPETPAELIAICGKAMARNPEARYASVEGLAADLRAFTEGRVVESYERGFFAEAKKLVLRNRGLAVTMTALVLVVLAAMTTVTWVHTRANQRLESSNEDLRRARLEAEEHAEDAQRMAVEAARGQREEARRRFSSQVTAAFLSISTGDLRSSDRLLQSLPQNLRGWEAEHLAQRVDGSVLSWSRRGPEGRPVLAPPVALGASSEGGVVVGYSDGSILLFDPTGTHIRREMGDSSHALQAMAVSTNGEWAGAISPDGWVQLWRLEDGERVQAIGLDESPSSLAFAPDDRILLIGTEEGAVLTLDSEGVRGELSRFDEAVKAIATAGDRLGIALSGGDVVILDADSGREVLRLERAGPELTAMSLDSDGGSLAVGDETGSVVVYSTKTGELVELLPRHSGRITAIFFDRVQRRFVSASRNGTLVADGKGGPSVYRGHSGPISGACINAAGTRYLSASMDRTLRVWDARSPAD
jgi:hypothetical protein